MKRTILWATVAILTGAAASGPASAQVVSDDACPKYAVDIAAFATCESDRLAKEAPATEKLVTVGPDETIAASSGTARQDESVRGPRLVQSRAIDVRSSRETPAAERSRP